MAGPSLGLQAAGLLLKALDLAVWFMMLGPVWMVIEKNKVPAINAKPAGTADVNENGGAPSKIFRSVQAIKKGELVREMFPGINTLYALMVRAVKRYKNKNALGTRTFLENKIEEGMRFPTKVFGKTTWLTFEQAGEKMHHFGSGLKELGMESLHLKEGQSLNDVSGAHTLLMYEDTSAEWFVSAQGAMTQSIVVATTYATLGIDSVISAVQETGAPAIVCNYAAVQKILARKNDMPSLKTVIYTMVNVAPTAPHPGQDPDVKVMSYDEVIELGRTANHPPNPPTEDDIAVLMYTSGSTGKPKGVMVRHRHLCGMLAAVQARTMLQEGEMLVGYLPLAHIFEMQMEFFVFSTGGSIGYADPKTLVAGPGKCSPVGALVEFRPTIMGAVPKVWEVIKAGAEAKVKAGGAAKEFLFNTALEWKKNAGASHRGTPVFDKLVFGKIKATLGGRLKLALSGGGAISADVQDWVTAAFGCPLIQGYGLTETCAGLTVQSIYDKRSGIVGAPVDSCEVLLHSEPDITDSAMKPYLTTDTEHLGLKGIQGRGEVWVRGSTVTDGYFKMPAETASAYHKDGWFQTGDIAIMLADGSLQIVDRKKNLVKLKGGEYIALERMNNTFNQSYLVDKDAGGCSSYGDHDMDRPIAFVQLNAEKVKELAAKLGVSGDDAAALIKDKTVVAEIVKELNSEGKKQDPPLTALEQLAGIIPLLTPWTALEGTLTASLKIAPKMIQHVYAEELKATKPKGIR